MSDKQLPPAEALKVRSNYLRGDLKETLGPQEIGRLSTDNDNLMKFHGMYQQRSRDKDASDRTHTLMVRGRIPGGRLTAEQWLVWDHLATEFGTGGLRITTRQGLQLHGVLIHQAKTVAKNLHQVLQSSSGACGDVVRNVTQAINPWGYWKLSQLDGVVDRLADRFRVKSTAYADIFLDGEPVKPDGIEEEPIYGSAYLPRKFKIAVTVAGNNSVDIYTNDLGFAASFDEKNQLAGYFIFAGGGMGMSHNRPETFPRLADYLGWVEERALIPIAEAAVGIQKDFGDRSDRKHARLKYTIEDRGVAWFREELQTRAGFRLVSKALPRWETPNYLGWNGRADGTLTLGFHVPSGRIKDDLGTRLLRTALRTIVREFRPGIQLTPDQDLILMGFKAADRKRVDEILSEHHVESKSSAPLFDRALACVALPMCGKALAEGERIYPALLSEINGLLKNYGLESRAPVVRITGCPNGCARPYAAEIGIVGQLPDQYALFLGGSREGTRLSFQLLEKVFRDEIPNVLDRLFRLWALRGQCGESFGDFTARWPEAQLREIALDEASRDLWDGVSAELDEGSVA